MSADATRERVALQGRFPATAEVKEVMAGRTVCFIFLGLLFHESALAPAAPETLRTRTCAGERGGLVAPGLTVSKGTGTRRFTLAINVRHFVATNSMQSMNHVMKLPG